MNTAASATSPDGARVLYLSYDGMSDPLGQSQVLPYLAGLAERGHRITLVSFEKSGRSAAEKDAARAAVAQAGVEWHPLDYHKRPPIASTLYDLAAMRRAAERLQREAGFDLVHCRSYLPAMVGLALKRRHGVALLFDMRGFWADERVDGGLWDLRRPHYRAVYRYMKAREAELLRRSDHVVSLTEAARTVMLERPDGAAAEVPISVIPCCVDFDHFEPRSAARKATVRAALGIAPGRRVAAYLGSIGTWYMLGEMLDCFKVQLERDPEALLLVVTRDAPGPILAEAEARGIPPSAMLIRPASRAEVPDFTAVADYGLFFITPAFSKTASCPTKLGEFLALEVPVLTNKGVGDVERIVGEIGAGEVVGAFDAQAYGAALDRLEAGPARRALREPARRWFDLDQGVERYDSIYRALVSERNKATRRGA